MKNEKMLKCLLMFSPIFLFLLVGQMLSARSDIRCSSDFYSFLSIFQINTDSITPKLSDVEEIRDKDRKVYTVVEQMPSFPGGEIAMMKYIRDNLKMPKDDMESGIQGRLSVRFVINEDGSISDITILRKRTPASDEMLVDLVKSMPKWTPGKHEGKNVAVYFTLPIFVCTR